MPGCRDAIIQNVTGLLISPRDTRSYDLSASFVKLGHVLVIITSTSNKMYENSSKWNIELTENLEIHRIYLPYSNHFSNFKRSLVFLKFLWYASFRLLRLKGDVLLATSTPLTIGIPALIKKWFGKTPYIFEVRDVWPEAVMAISDRLHVLIAAFTKGVIPVNLASSYSDKVDAHFDVIGVNNVTIDTNSNSKETIINFLETKLLNRFEEAKMVDAKKRLEIIRQIISKT